jgi:hypothetical protein
MNTTGQPESPTRRLWPGWAALILAGQAGFIFWLGAKHPVAPRPPSFPPPVTLAPGDASELAALRDPTVFTLPGRHGFSGAAWLLTPKFQFTAADWDEPFRPLPLPAEKLGASFRELLVDLRAAPPPVAEKIPPQISALELPAETAPLPAASTLRVEGAVAGRAPAAPADLPAWPIADVLRASEVRVLVDAAGRVVSAVLLAASGLSDADQKALELSRTTRFAPVNGGPENPAPSAATVNSGRMIFHWRTIAPPPPETPPANP